MGIHPREYLWLLPVPDCFRMPCALGLGGSFPVVVG